MRGAARSSRALLVLVGVTPIAAACADPVRDEAIAALGDEDPRVAAGAFHRPGQPCLACHDGKGSARAFSVAGTIYRDDRHALPAGDVDVLLTDAARHSFATKTNCAGSFFVRASDYTPRFPVWVTVRRDGRSIDMESPMNESGDCGACHREPKGASSAGRVFLEPSSPIVETIPAGCGGEASR